jgi:hypothetical protein
MPNQAKYDWKGWIFEKLLTCQSYNEMLPEPLAEKRLIIIF